MHHLSLATAAAYLRAATAVVCLTGAGVSAESGVPTFRDAQTGFWSHLRPEQLASQSGFAADPGLVWRWYMQRMAGVRQAAPNPAHLPLAALEQATLAAPGKSWTLVTQNVDDLHERAGSRKVLHLHGEIARFRCNRCSAAYELQPADLEAEQPPRCLQCGERVRPAVVWFGEMLPERIAEQAWAAARRCDLMLVVGTSGVVYPAAQLPDLARAAGARILEINLEATPLSGRADVTMLGAAGTILPQLQALLRRS